MEYIIDSAHINLYTKLVYAFRSGMLNYTCCMHTVTLGGINKIPTAEQKKTVQNFASNWLDKTKNDNYLTPSDNAL